MAHEPPLAASREDRRRSRWITSCRNALRRARIVVDRAHHELVEIDDRAGHHSGAWRNEESHGVADIVGDTARRQAASTQTGGVTLLLKSIATTVIGGASLFCGRGSVWAALLDASVIGSVSSGLDLVGQPADVKYMVEGAVLLLAVTLDAYSRRRPAVTGR